MDQNPNALRPLLLASALLVAGGAAATPALPAKHCAHTRVEQPAIDLAGIRELRISVAADLLDLREGRASLGVRHCASSAEGATTSRIDIERRGDILHIESRGSAITAYGLFGRDIYTWRSIELRLPADLPVRVSVGSGEAAIEGFEVVDLRVGSGDAELRQVGKVSATVGSGDLRIEEAATLALDVGSGDARVRRVQGATRVRVGSGDAVLEDVGPLGPVSVGSGDLAVQHVRGSAWIASLGSGGIELRRVGGDVRIDQAGSGRARIEAVEGDLVAGSRKALDATRTRDIKGRTLIGE